MSRQEWTVTADATEERPGGPARPARLHAENAAGVSVGMWASYGPANAADAFVADIAAVLPDASRAIALAEDRAAAAEARAEACAASLRGERDRTRRLLAGGRFFGRVLIQVDESGRAWAMDPCKRDRGFGFRFESLAVLWRQWPDLRPVAWEGGDLICESFALEVTP